MEDSLLSDEKLKKLYQTLQKSVSQIKKDSPKLLDEEFGQRQWDKEGSKIEKNIKLFHKGLKDLKNKLEDAKENGTVKEEMLDKIEGDLEKIENNTIPIVEQMEEKIRTFEKPDLELKEKQDEEEEEEKGQQQEMVMDLMNNKEMLKQRREVLQDIHQTAALIKETTDQMKTQLNEQGEMLENIEAHVVKTEDNVDKAGKEINKANEYSKGNTKRCCFIISIILLVVIVAIAVVLSLVL